MLDRPTAPAILDAALVHLRDTVLPAVGGRAAFDLRVALSALDLVARELAAGPGAAAAERAELAALLGSDGELETQTRTLAARIEAGTIAADDPALIAHLYRTTLAKLAVDQPGYSAYRRHVETPR